MKPAIERKNLSFDFSFPAKAEPAWKDAVDRWYQLDAFAYGLAEAYCAWSEMLAASPELIILASPGASNETDRAFAMVETPSPAKFVHTLPNVRVSPLCQVMSWTGPVLCLQNDPDTLATAIEEAAAFCEADFASVWTLGVTALGNGKYRVHGHFLRRVDGKGSEA